MILLYIIVSLLLLGSPILILFLQAAIGSPLMDWEAESYRACPDFAALNFFIVPRGCKSVHDSPLRRSVLNRLFCVPSSDQTVKQSR